METNEKQTKPNIYINLHKYDRKKTLLRQQLKFRQKKKTISLKDLKKYMKNF